MAKKPKLGSGKRFAAIEEKPELPDMIIHLLLPQVLELKSMV